MPNCGHSPVAQPREKHRRTTRLLIYPAASEILLLTQSQDGKRPHPTRIMPALLVGTGLGDAGGINRHGRARRSYSTEKGVGATVWRFVEASEADIRRGDGPC